jgi:hypothetical protein
MAKNKRKPGRKTAAAAALVAAAALALTGVGLATASADHGPLASKGCAMNLASPFRGGC